MIKPKYLPFDLVLQIYLPRGPKTDADGSLPPSATNSIKSWSELCRFEIHFSRTWWEVEYRSWYIRQYLRGFRKKTLCHTGWIQLLCTVFVFDSIIARKQVRTIHSTPVDITKQVDIHKICDINHVWGHENGETMSNTNDHVLWVALKFFLLFFLHHVAEVQFVFLFVN